MRKFTMHTAVLAAVFAASIPFSAQAELKIASIRSGELLLSSPQFKASSDKFKQEFEKRGKDLETEGKKFQEDAKKFQKEADLMAGAERARQEKDLQTRQIDLGYKQRQLQEDAQSRERQLTQEMRGKLQDVIQAYSKEKGYDLVVQDPVYATDAVDITGEVLKRLQSVK